MKVSLAAPLCAFLTCCAVCSADAKRVTPARGQSSSATVGIKQSTKTRVVKKTTTAARPVETAFRKTPYVGAMAVDADDGKILFAANADAPAYPASCTKLMTLFLVLEDVKAGKFRLDEAVVATPEVNRCEASWVGLKAGETMTVRDLCLSLMVESANDAAIVLAVKCNGSLAAFVARMNQRAAALGMANTKYYNANGLPAPKYGKHFNVSTAADQLLLARAIARLPEVWQFTRVKTCDLVRCPGGYRVSITRQANAPSRTTDLAAGESIVKQMRNHNNVMVKDKLKLFNPDGTETVDGLKTGYIDAGGSSVVISGARGGRRVLVAVLGSASAKLRDENARAILEKAFAKLTPPAK